MPPQTWTSIADGVGPRWSPNGGRILYSTTGARNRLWTINPDGTAPRKLTGATPDADDDVQSWAWSADGRTILLAGRSVDATDTAGEADLYFVDVNGLRRWPAAPATPSIDEQFVSVSGALHATTPDVPTAVSATAVTDSAAVLVQWSARADGGAPVTSYVVEAQAAPGGSFITKATTTGTSVVFSGLTLGFPYYFTVAAANAEGTGGWSVAAGPATPRVHTRTTIGPVTASYVYGAGSVHVAGRVTRVGTGGPAHNAVVQLQARPAGSTSAFHNLTVTTSDAHGYVLFAGYKPARSIQYRSLTTTYGGFFASGTGARTVTVHPRVWLGLSASRVRPGTAVHVTGRVAPDLTGRAVWLQRWVNSAWHRVATGTLTSQSRCGFTIRKRTAGRYRFRAIVPATPGLSTGSSALVTLRVAR